MTLKTKALTLTEKLDYKTNDTGKLKIPLDNLIRRMEMLVTLVLETPAAMTAGITPKIGGVLAAAKKVRLVMNGDQNKFNTDAFKWHESEKIEKGTPAKLDSLSIPAAGATTTHEFVLNADFATFRQDLRDVSALLPAVKQRMESLQLEVDWGAIADLLGTPNDTIIKSGDVQITLTQVYDDVPAEHAKLLAGNFIDIREGIERFEVTKAHSSYDTSELAQNVNPAPNNILAQMLVAIEDITSVSGIPALANDVVTRLKVANTRGAGEQIIEKLWKQLHFSNKSEFSLETLTTGVAYIDWVDERRGGLANFDPEAIKWKFLTNAPVATETDAIDIFTRYVAGIAK